MKELPGEGTQQDQGYARPQQSQRWELSIQQEEPYQPNPEDKNGSKAVTGYQMAELNLGHRQQQRHQSQEWQSAQVDEVDNDRDQDSGSE